MKPRSKDRISLVAIILFGVVSLTFVTLIAPSGIIIPFVTAILLPCGLMGIFFARRPSAKEAHVASLLGGAIYGALIPSITSYNTIHRFSTWTPSWFQEMAFMAPEIGSEHTRHFIFGLSIVTFLVTLAIRAMQKS